MKFIPLYVALYVAPGARAPWRRLSVVVSPGVGVCGYPVRTGCGHVCGGQDLQTHFFLITKA